VVTCSFCGTVVESDEPPLTWISSVERGKQRWYCDECSRTHLRAMESKLDSEWW
jgi:transposase-like protein